MVAFRAFAVGASLVITGAAIAQNEPARPKDAAQPARPRDAAQPAAAQPAKPATTLKVGDRAPELAIERWVKGEPVTGFEKGRVYVVEFWATWCGPCIAGMPHISELQKEYKEKGVTVIGVNIWDEPKNVDPFMKDRGDKPKGDDLMGYTVAVEKKDNADDPRNGVMSRTWMKAAGRNGIPSAFVVDQAGTVAWIGHPAQMDKPLEQIVAGKWDIKKAAADEAALRAAEGKLRDYAAAIRSGDTDRAYTIGRELVDGPVANNAGALNAIAWPIVDPAGKVEKKDLDLALRAAKRAVELTESKDAAILDTLARVHFCKGDVAKAVELQTKAVEIAPAQMKEELQGALDEYKKASK